MQTAITIFPGFYERVVAYKKRGLKVSLALGGWNDSEGGKYSRLVNSPEARKRFIEHALQFVEKYGFDGLDLDWEYPVCWQVNYETLFLLFEVIAIVRVKKLLLQVRNN